MNALQLLRSGMDTMAIAAYLRRDDPKMTEAKVYNEIHRLRQFERDELMRSRREISERLNRGLIRHAGAERSAHREWDR